MEEVWEFDVNRQDHQANSDAQRDDIIPSILCPNYADSLIYIINKLDNRSFTKLSMTCRYLNDICWNAKGINKIPFNFAVDVSPFGFNIWTGERDHFYNERNRRDINFNQFERLLNKKQFRFNMDLVHITALLNETSMTNTSEFLATIGCERTKRLWVSDYSFAMEPELLIQFVKELRVKEFRCDYILPRSSITHFLENMHSFHYDEVVPSDFFIGTKVPPRLHLMGTNAFSFDTFMEILEGWENREFEIDEWNLGSNFRPRADLIANFLQHFDNNYVLIDSIFETPLPSIRPLLLLEPEKFPRYMLRSDGQILGFYYSVEGENGLFLRRMKFSQLRKKIPKLFPSFKHEGFFK